MKKTRHLTSCTRHTGIAKIIGFLLVLALQLTTFRYALPNAQAAEPAPPSVRAPMAIVVDANTGRILYSKDSNRRSAIASTTKIMSALTALNIPGTKLDDKYTVVAADLIGEATMYLRLGETLSFEDLLYGMMLNSGNDAASAIARYAGAKLPGEGDPVTRFVAKMNQQAQIYGLKNTQFANPHGLDAAGHYSSAFDLAITAWYLLKQPVLSRIVATTDINVAGHNLITTNSFLRRYAGATGIKPGETDNAGLCLVASATRNGQTIITVVLNEDVTGYNADPTTLTDYAFKVVAQPRAPASNPANENYIGQPDGDKLIMVGVKTDSGAPLAGHSTALELPRFFNAQIVQAQALPTPTVGSVVVNTPDTLATAISSSDNSGARTSVTGSQQTQTASSGTGPGFFLILLILAIILAALWAAARFGYIGGERGQDIAFRVEDAVIAASKTVRNGINSLISRFRKTEGTSSRNADTDTPGGRTAPQPGQTYRYTPRNQQPENPPTPRPTNNNSTGIYNAPTTPRRQPAPSQNTDYTYSDTAPPPRPNPFNAPPFNKVPLNANEEAKNPNPLDNFFDDVEPFNVESSQEGNLSASAPPPPLRDNPRAATGSTIVPNPFGPPTIADNNAALPPAPTLRPNPPVNPGFPTRTAAEPQQTPSTSYELRPPRPIAPNQPPPTQRPASGSGQEKSNYSKGNAGLSGQESLIARAQAAIDYAYAGRIQASTDEFRKVIEQEPLFDFGGLDAFEQMPVLGYKALAGAYRNAGHVRFAILLLDVAIEKFPNELEFRNMLRSFKREYEM